MRPRIFAVLLFPAGIASAAGAVGVFRLLSAEFRSSLDGIEIALLYTAVSGGIMAMITLLLFVTLRLRFVERDGKILIEAEERDAKH